MTTTSSLGRQVRSLGVVGVLLAGIVVVGGGGCADVVTHSKQAKKQGIRELAAGNFTDAAGSFNNATRQNPRDYESHYYKGVAYDKLGSHQQAIQALRTSLSTMNETVDGRNARRFRLKVLDQLAMVIAKTADRQAQVTDLERRAAGRETAEDLFLIAKVHRYSGDPDSAIDAYKRAAHLDPKSFDIQKEYALYLEQLNQIDLAQPQLVRAHNMREDDQEIADALRRIGVVPGVSLRDEDDLSRPALPKGPLPEIELTPMGGGNQTAGATGAAGPRD